MESDSQLRERILAEYDRLGLDRDHAQWQAIQTWTGVGLDHLALVINLQRRNEMPSDPFGDAIKAAQDLPELTPAKGYVPDTFDADEVWRAVMEHRS